MPPISVQRNDVANLAQNQQQQRGATANDDPPAVYHGIPSSDTALDLLTSGLTNAELLATQRTPLDQWHPPMAAPLREPAIGPQLPSHGYTPTTVFRVQVEPNQPAVQLNPSSLSGTTESLQAGLEAVTGAESKLYALDTEINSLGDNDPLIDARVNERNELEQSIVAFRAAASELVPTLDGAQERYLATSIGSPQSINPTLRPNLQGSNQPGISTDTGQTVVPLDAKVTYELKLAPYIASGPPTISAFAINDPAAVARGDVPATVELGDGLRIDAQAAVPGNHQIVYEVQFGNQPPQYHTYVQQVVTPEQAATRALDASSTPPQPELLKIGLDTQIHQGEQHLASLQTNPTANRDNIEVTERALAELREARAEIPQRLSEDAIAEAIPIRSTLLVGENGAVIPLQLYAKPMQDGRWAIVDVTNPSSIRSYTGDSANDATSGLDSAWDGFIANNDLPGGRIAAERPVAGSGYADGDIAAALESLPNDAAWHSDSDGRSDLQSWRDNLGFASIGLAALGVGAIVAAPFTGGATAAAVPWLFGAAGVAGAASAGFNIADRVNHGEFEWQSSETALDLLGVAGGITGAGSSALTIARSGTTTVALANGSRVAVTEADDLGRWLMLSSQVDTVAGAASGVIVTREYLQQIEDVRQDPSLSEAERESQVANLTREAAAVGALMVLGVGLGASSVRQAAAQAPETIALTNLRGELSGADLNQLVVEHGSDAVIWAGQQLDGPAARALLDDLTPNALRNLSSQPPADVVALQSQYRSLGLDFADLAETRSFTRLQQIEGIISDSNPKQRHSLVNAERVLDEFHPPGYVLNEVKGPGGKGPDLVFTHPSTGDSFKLENKSVANSRRFNEGLSYAVKDQHADLVFMQVPDGTDAQNWLAKFVGIRLAADSQTVEELTTVYAKVDVVVADVAGNVLLPRQPIYNP